MHLLVPATVIMVANSMSFKNTTFSGNKSNEHMKIDFNILFIFRKKRKNEEEELSFEINLRLIFS